jgi:hypothetical protein
MAVSCGVMYLLTLVSPISIPSFSSSPWIFGTPQSGFSRLIVRISPRTLPQSRTARLAGRILHVQNKREPFRCHPMTVEPFAMWAKPSICHAEQSQAQAVGPQL